MAEISAREAVTAAALRGDAAMLRASASELPPFEAYRYDRQRATAFAAALEGNRDRAFTQLELGGGGETAQRLRIDVALLELLLGQPAAALAALRLAVRDVARIEPEVSVLLAECVRQGGARARDAIRVGVGSGTPAQRTRSAATLAPVVARDALDAVVPAVAVVSLVVAIVALARLPSLGGGAELAVPAPQHRGSTVVVAKPPRTEPRERPAESPRPATAVPSAAFVPVAVRTPTRVSQAKPLSGSRPRPSVVGRAPAPAPAVASRVLAVAARPPASPSAVARAPATASKSRHEPRGRARGHEKQAQREQKRGAAPPAAAPPPTEPADKGEKAHSPGPPDHANGHGRENAPGQRK